MTSSEDTLIDAVLGSCIAVHRELGPGEDEIAYEQALSAALHSRGILHVCQLPLPLNYRGHTIDCGFRLDTMVASRLPLELKSVEAIHPVHVAQTLTYMRLCDRQLGFLINFDVPALRLGIRRLRDDVRRVCDLRPPRFNTGDSVVDALLTGAARVHQSLGPGLLQSAYEACLIDELTKQRIPHATQHNLPLGFQGIALPHHTTVPLLVDARVPVTCVCATRISQLHIARMLSRLRRSGWPYGFVLNFNVTAFSSGIRRVISDRSQEPPCSCASVV